MFDAKDYPATLRLSVLLSFTMSLFLFLFIRCLAFPFRINHRLLFLLLISFPSVLIFDSCLLPSLFCSYFLLSNSLFLIHSFTIHCMFIYYFPYALCAAIHAVMLSHSLPPPDPRIKSFTSSCLRLSFSLSLFSSPFSFSLFLRYPLLYPLCSPFPPLPLQDSPWLPFIH